MTVHVIQSGCLCIAECLLTSLSHMRAAYEDEVWEQWPSAHGTQKYAFPAKILCATHSTSRTSTMSPILITHHTVHVVHIAVNKNTHTQRTSFSYHFVVFCLLFRESLTKCLWCSFIPNEATMPVKELCCSWSNPWQETACHFQCIYSADGSVGACQA